MASTRNLLTAPLNNYKPIVWQGQPVYATYSRLQTYLRIKLGEQFAALLAQPNTQGGSHQDITWVSDKIGRNAVPLASLPETEQASYKSLLDSRLGTLLHYAQSLQQSNNLEERNWGELIEHAFTIPDYNHVFVENDQLVLVAWGFTVADAKQESVFSKNLNRGQTPLPIVADEIPVPIPAQTAPIEQPVEAPPPPPLPPPEMPEPPFVTAAPPLPPRRAWNWGWLKWLLGALLLLLLILLLSMLFRHCGCLKMAILPKHPGVIIPIDDRQVISDPDSIRMIVSNRLNIALIGKNNDISAFAAAFKQVYPSNEYQIIYYDTLTFRLQIQIPDDARENLIAEIPLKLPAFEMLVWHESLFQSHRIPSDPSFQNPDNSWYFEAIGAYGAWESGYGDAKIVIAVIDDGLDIDHPEFQGKIFKPWNVCTHSDNIMANADRQHGTHVAGIATSINDNNKGLAGIAPACRLMPIMVVDANGMISSTAIIDAILYAINQGANVINLSLGMKLSDVVGTYPLRVQQDIISHNYKSEEVFWDRIYKMANDRNITLVMAGGNQNILVGIDPMQRSPLTIKVSALDPQFEKANFSNFGAYSTISAPGVHIFSSIPGDKYAFMDGTSMAAPIVTGGVALIKSRQPNITNSKLIELLQRSGKPINTRDGGCRVGNLIQLDRALAGEMDEAQTSPPNEACTDIKWRIDSLLREIEYLRGLCPEMDFGQDTMRMPVNGDLGSTSGRWRSTTPLHNTGGELITIYFDISASGEGLLTLVEPDQTQCIAELHISYSNPVLAFDQIEPAACANKVEQYNAYYYTCQADANGLASCVAQNKKIKANRIAFKLIKVNNH
jgi:hypothetical protein